MPCRIPSVKSLTKPLEIKPQHEIQSEDSKYQKFKIENITVARAPLLKVYYWECFDIDGLNAKIDSEDNDLEHTIDIPTNQINSKPLKVILWVRNCSKESLELRLKRIKNCECIPLPTRVGFNQFRNLYHCPHRRLIHILQDYIVMKPDDLVAMSIVSYYFLFGEYKLTYEMNCSDSRKIFLTFNLDIIGFDPQKCNITKELIPIDIREFRRFVQPIWVRNITMQNINLIYGSRDRNLKLLNPNLTVPRQSVWPLMVEYRPSDFNNQLDLSVSFENVRTKFQIKASAYLGSDVPEPFVPIDDYECVDFPYVIYPNRLDFNVAMSENHSLMVSIHNYNQKCFEFRWQNYIINNLFEVTFEPNIFRLKPHHSKLCLVKLRVQDRPLYFRRIPCVLEVHRVFDKCTQIAKELLTEVESIDDPKWKEESYMQHVFLQLNIRVNFKPPKSISFPECEQPTIIPTTPTPKDKQKRSMTTTTIFEKLYWEYLSRSNFMRVPEDGEINDEMSYEEVLNLCEPIEEKEESAVLNVNQNDILNILGQLVAEGVRDLSKNWRFVPIDFAEET